MTKICIGCGIKLQNTDKEKLGFTPDLNNPLCMRCFKLKNYGILLDTGKIQDNEKLLLSINKKKGLVIFLVDFLNIYKEAIDLFKNIKLKKVLVITKSDLIPKNIQINVLVKNIKDIYDINEEIIVCSAKTKYNLNKIQELINSESSILFTGYTNMGKSSLMNTLFHSNITVSKRKNTTQEFIKKVIAGQVIYDAPGFINEYYDNIPKNIIKPLTYQLKSKYYLKIADINISFNSDDNITIYIDNNINVSKRKILEKYNYDIVVPANYDIVIKGLGFIKVTKATYMYINVNKELIELRPSIIGGNYE